MRQRRRAYEPHSVFERSLLSLDGEQVNGQKSLLTNGELPMRSRAEVGAIYAKPFWHIFDTITSTPKCVVSVDPIWGEQGPFGDEKRLGTERER